MNEAELPTLVIARGRERSLLRRHPWIFSGAIADVRGRPESGATVRVVAHDGSFLAWAAYSPESQIRARVWDFDQNARIDEGFFEARLRAALALREGLVPEVNAAAMRLLHAESDGLPGLIVDRYGSQLVLQATSAGAARHRELLADLLCRVTGLSNVYERSDGDAIALEGLPARSGVLRGEASPAPLEVIEQGLSFELDIAGGHKTGFYLDQRDNRSLIRGLAGGRDVLDCFCYSGGFALNAAFGAPRSVTAVDSSEPALELARRNAERNRCGGGRVNFERGDVFEWLRKARDRRASFDLIILDPPKLAPNARFAEKAARAYKDINLLAFKLLRKGGLLATFSCSGGVSGELLQKIVAGAAVDAGVDAAFVRRLQAGPDHPISLAFPEGEYLKGLLCRVAA